MQRLESIAYDAFHAHSYLVLGIVVLVIYGISVFGGTSKRLTACLQVLQNKTARLYTRLPKMGTTISYLLGQADFLSVHQLSVYHSLVQYWKIRKYKSPEYLYDRILNIDVNMNQNCIRKDRVAKQKFREIK